MLSFPPSPQVRIFVCRRPVDMRKSFDGLTGAVIDIVDQDPQSGHLFLFFNKRRSMMKALVGGVRDLDLVQATRRRPLPVRSRQRRRGELRARVQSSRFCSTGSIYAVQCVRRSSGRRVARHLNDAIRALRCRVAPIHDLDEATAQVAELHATVEQQSQEIAEQSQEIQVLREKLAYLKKQLFGRRREKIDPSQLQLFEQSSARRGAARAQRDSNRTRPWPLPKGHGRAPFAEDLLREVIALDLPEAERCCPDRGVMRPIGVAVTERAHIPARLVVKRERQKYACAKGTPSRSLRSPTASTRASTRLRCMPS